MSGTDTPERQVPPAPKEATPLETPEAGVSTPVHPAPSRMSDPTADTTFIRESSTDPLAPGPVRKEPIIGRPDGTEPVAPIDEEARMIANTPPEVMAMGMARSGVPEGEARKLLKQYYPGKENEINNILQDQKIKDTFAQVRIQPAPEGTVAFGQTEEEKAEKAHQLVQDPEKQKAARQLAAEGENLFASGASDKAKQAWLDRVKGVFGGRPGEVLMNITKYTSVGLGIFGLLFLLVMSMYGSGGK